MEQGYKSLEKKRLLADESESDSGSENDDRYESRGSLDKPKPEPKFKSIIKTVSKRFLKEEEPEPELEPDVEEPEERKLTRTDSGFLGWDSFGTNPENGELVVKVNAKPSFREGGGTNYTAVHQKKPSVLDLNFNKDEIKDDKTEETSYEYDESKLVIPGTTALLNDEVENLTVELRRCMATMARDLDHTQPDGYPEPHKLTAPIQLNLLKGVHGNFAKVGYIAWKTVHLIDRFYNTNGSLGTAQKNQMGLFKLIATFETDINQLVERYNAILLKINLGTLGKPLKVDPYHIDYNYEGEGQQIVKQKLQSLEKENKRLRDGVKNKAKTFVKSFDTLLDSLMQTYTELKEGKSHRKINLQFKNWNYSSPLVGELFSLCNYLNFIIDKDKRNDPKLIQLQIKIVNSIYAIADLITRLSSKPGSVNQAETIKDNTLHLQYVLTGLLNILQQYCTKKHRQLSKQALRGLFDKLERLISLMPEGVQGVYLKHGDASDFEKLNLQKELQVINDSKPKAFERASFNPFDTTEDEAVDYITKDIQQLVEDPTIVRSSSRLESRVGSPELFKEARSHQWSELDYQIVYTFLRNIKLLNKDIVGQPEESESLQMFLAKQLLKQNNKDDFSMISPILQKEFFTIFYAVLYFVEGHLQYRNWGPNHPATDPKLYNFYSQIVQGPIQQNLQDLIENSNLIYAQDNNKQGVREITEDDESSEGMELHTILRLDVEKQQPRFNIIEGAPSRRLTDESRERLQQIQRLKRNLTESSLVKTKLTDFSKGLNAEVVSKLEQDAKQHARECYDNCNPQKQRRDTESRYALKKLDSNVKTWKKVTIIGVSALGVAIVGGFVGGLAGFGLGGIVGGIVGGAAGGGAAYGGIKLYEKKQHEKLDKLCAEECKEINKNWQGFTTALEENILALEGPERYYLAVLYSELYRLDCLPVHVDATSVDQLRNNLQTSLKPVNEQSRLLMEKPLTLAQPILARNPDKKDLMEYFDKLNIAPTSGLNFENNEPKVNRPSDEDLDPFGSMEPV